jgi:hypothetical protein
MCESSSTLGAASLVVVMREGGRGGMPSERAPDSHKPTLGGSVEHVRPTQPTLSALQP